MVQQTSPNKRARRNIHETAAIFGQNWNLWSWNAGPERWASLPDMTQFQIFNYFTNGMKTGYKII